MELHRWRVAVLEMRKQFRVYISGLVRPHQCCVDVGGMPEGFRPDGLGDSAVVVQLPDLCSTIRGAGQYSVILIRPREPVHKADE
jgi:hypothetical protein